MAGKRVWVWGNRQKGASIRKSFLQSKLTRGKRVTNWLLERWRNGQQSRRLDSFPTRQEAVSYARGLRRRFFD